VPRSLARLEVASGMGPVTGRALEGEVHISSGLGSVRIVESHLQGEVHSGMGEVSLSAVYGTASVHSGNGNVTIEDCAGGRLTVNTGRGNVALGGGRLDELTATTGAGGIRFRCALGPGSFRLESGAGNIDLELPADTAAQVEAVSGIGAVHSDWPLVRVGRPGPVVAGSVRMVGAIGDETRRARLTVKTGVGDISLRRRTAAEDTPSASPAATPAQAPGGPEPPDPPTAPAGGYEPPASPEAADARTAILESLARREITVDEAVIMLERLGG